MAGIISKAAYRELTVLAETDNITTEELHYTLLEKGYRITAKTAHRTYTYAKCIDDSITTSTKQGELLRELIKVLPEDFASSNIKVNDLHNEWHYGTSIKLHSRSIDITIELLI